MLLEFKLMIWKVDISLRLVGARGGSTSTYYIHIWYDNVRALSLPLSLEDSNGRERQEMKERDKAILPF